MFLLCLFAILFSVQCAPYKENSNLNEAVFSKYENLLDKVNTYAKIASNFQKASGEHERLRRSTNDDGFDDDHHYDHDKTYVPYAISKDFSKDVDDFIADFLDYLEDIEPSVEYEEKEFHEIDDDDSDFVVKIIKTEEPLKHCISLKIEIKDGIGFGYDDKVILTVFVNDECAKEAINSWDTTEEPDVWDRPEWIDFH